jgi:hypothetical protein
LCKSVGFGIDVAYLLNQRLQAVGKATSLKEGKAMPEELFRTMENDSLSENNRR